MYFLRLLTKKLLFIVHIIAAILLLGGCLIPYINPDHFWPVSFLGLAFPYVLAVILAFFFFWLIFHPRYSLLSVAVILVGWKSVAVVFGFHPGRHTPGSQDSAITVMSYNVRYFKNFDYTAAGNTRLRHQIFDLITAQHPDILCLQEFYTSENPRDHDNKADLSHTLGLPYRYFSSNHNYENNHSGVILFSRYPIIHTEKIKLLAQYADESALFADVVPRPGDTIRIFTLHLQSVYLSHQDLSGLQKVKLQEDTGFVASRIILGKLRTAFAKRSRQARTMAQEISKSPYPVILCGDFNDTPNSYAYFKIRGALQDAFLKKGFGLGRTYSGIAPTLRIDYIFCSRQFSVASFQRIKRALSDHYPIVAALRYRPQAAAQDTAQNAPAGH